MNRDELLELMAKVSAYRAGKRLEAEAAAKAMGEAKHGISTADLYLNALGVALTEGGELNHFLLAEITALVDSEGECVP